MSAEKEYLEVKTEIKDNERKIEVLKKEIKDLLDKDEEDYQRLLDKDVLTESEKYRKNNFESKLAELKEDLTKLKEDLTKLKKTEDFWMSQIKFLTETRQLQPQKKSKEPLKSSKVVRLNDTEGINVNYPFLHRPSLLNAVLASIKDERMVLLCSPSASGKTSLLDMMLQKTDILCIYLLCCVTNFSTSNLLLGIVCDPEGQQYNLHEIKDPCIVMLDDAQTIYDQVEFWAHFKKAARRIFPPHISFLIVATHILEGGQESPVELADLKRFGREDFLLSEEDAISFLQNTDFGLTRRLRNEKLINLIVTECAGLVGALRITCKALRDRFGKHQSAIAPAVYKYYQSHDWMTQMTRCFGSKHSSFINMHFNMWLSKCFMNHCAKPSEIIEEEEINCLKSLQKSGILMQSAVNSPFIFTSQMAKRYYSQFLFPDRKLKLPKSIDSLVRRIIKNMSASLLEKSRLNKIPDFPKEATLQHLFMHGLAKYTPASVYICPEYSVNKDDQTQMQGAIDFFLNGDLKWGFELLVNGKGIGEHVKRCKKGGKYHSLDMNDFVIVDFRRNKGNGFKGITSYKNRITVMFESDYSKCTCQFRKKGIKTLTLQP